MKRKLIILLFTIILVVIAWRLFIILLFTSIPEITVLQEAEIETYKISLYEIDPGAAGSFTVNLSIGKRIEKKDRGNVYCSCLPESSKTFFTLDGTNKIITIHVTERKQDIVLQKTEYEGFVIVYEY